VETAGFQLIHKTGQCSTAKCFKQWWFRI